MLQNAGVFNSLTCKCASRHSGVQFFDIKPPKSGPYPSVFPHFDLQICFAPQRRAIFEHRNFQNGSAHVVFCAFWLAKYASRHSGVQFFEHRNFQNGSGNVGVFVHFDLQMCFSPQPRGILEHRNFQNVSGTEVFSTFWRAKCASRHSRVPFFTCPRNSYLRTRRFSEATFRTSGTTTHWKKHSDSRTSTNIWRACWTPCYWLYTHVDLLATDSTRMLIFLLLTWLLCDSAFQLYILSEVRLLNFLR